MKSSIIDVPRRHDQDDLFGIKVYQDALIEYVKYADTPITIALQGEWGSGKTSLMNLLKWNLCDTDNAPYFPIWINTWQFSLMKSANQAIISILEGIVNQIGALNPNNKWNESRKKIGGIFKKMATVGAKVAAGSIGIDGGIVDALSKIEFFTEDELNDSTLAENISEIARLSVGTNPRSLKRLTNTLSLISIINKKMATETNQDLTYKTINFGLVCMQIAYPYIYNQLVEEPDFKAWNESIASRLKLRHLTEEEKETLNATEEFDEDWEKVTFRMCQKETHLSNRVFQVSGLLNKIATIIDNDSILGETVEAVIALSAVTNLKAFDKAPVIKSKALQINRFNGIEYKGKGKLCLAIVKYYVEKHPDITLNELKDKFNVMKSDQIVASLEEAMKTTDSAGKAGGSYYIKKDDQIKLKDGTKVVVWNYWSERYYSPFMECVNKLGIKVG